MKRRPLVLFHRSCFDGYTAAWVFQKFKGDAEFRSINYGEGPPDCSGREVWILDFSFKRDVMLNKVIIPSERTIVLDHHATAEDDLKDILQEPRKLGAQRNGADQVIFDMARSGAGITFDFLEGLRDKAIGHKTPRLNGMRAIPLVDFVEDRDLWRFKYPQTKSILAWVACQEMTFESWDALAAMCERATDGTIPAETAGNYVSRYIKNYGEKACAHAMLREIAGYTVPVLNIAYQNMSDHLQMLLTKVPDANFAAGFFMRDDGKWQFSLRSRPDFNVAEIAKKFGGGGHAQAAGFEVEYLPWERNEEASDTNETPKARRKG